MKSAAAVAATLLAALAVLAGCGSSASSSPVSACNTAAAAIPVLEAHPSRAAGAAAAAKAAAALTSLSAAVANLPTNSQDPEALANLRNGTNIASVTMTEVGELLSHPGSGILGPLKTQGLLAYTQIQQAATQLGVPACDAAALGGRLLGVLAARVVAPAGTDLATAAATACQDITEAYGTSQIAVDRKSGLTQLARSTAVLQAAGIDIADVGSPRGRALRAAVTHALAILAQGQSRVAAGANPSLVTITTFRAAGDVLRGGFASAGVACAIPEL